MAIYERDVKGIFERFPWGYSMPFLVSAKYHANPNYAMFYGRDAKVPSDRIDEILAEMTEDEKIIYKKRIAEKYL